MKISKLKVILRRRKGPWEAYIVQESAEGERKGTNLLVKRNLITEGSARAAVRNALLLMSADVDDIEFVVSDPEDLG